MPTNNLKNKKSIEIYTDGSALGNPGKGGYSFIIWDKENNSISEHGGGSPHATNNQMEMMALLEAMKFVKKITEARDINIHMDSDYVRNGITSWVHNWKKNNWRTANKKPVLNKEIWEQLDKTLEEVNKVHNIKINRIPGHFGFWGNERADSIAKDFAENGGGIRLFNDSVSEYEKAFALNVK